MDVSYGSMKVTKAKQQQQSAKDTTRPPLVPAEKNNAVAVTRRSRTMEVSSRYRSPSPIKTQRCSSPNVTRTLSSSSQSLSKRAVSAERKRSLTPTNPYTPISDVSIDLPVSSRRLSTGRLLESLWPSTMRSLSVSFQSDSISVPVVKKEKPFVTSSIDRTLRPSSNIAHKQQGETTSVSRKHTPERKRSPLKGTNVSAGQSENSKPVDGPHGRLIEQHRWPSRIGGKITSNSMNRSMDLGDKAVRRMSLPLSKSSKPLQKSSSDTARLLSCYENGGLVMSPTNSEDGNSLRWTSESHRLLSASSLDRTTLARVHPLSAPGSRAASPSRSSFSSSSSNSRGMSPSRGVSPLRGLSPSGVANFSCVRSSTPPPRGLSPSRIRQTNTSTQSCSSTTSVLSFFADVKKGKKATYIEDVHQLRLLYNRYSQWRFANARAEGVRYIQRLIAEETLYNVWHATSDLRDFVTTQRICLQQLKLENKLESILNDQMVCLEDWAILEREHISSLTGAIGDLQANTLRLPLTGGKKADLGSLKLAMSSALDVMQAMESSIWSLHSQMEEMNKLVSDLSVIATKENFMLDKCEDILASTAVMEIEESSLMTHLIQKKQQEEEEVRDDAASPLLPSSKFLMAITSTHLQFHTPTLKK